MDFGLNETQRDIQNLARKILQDHSTPARLLAYDNYVSERFDAELWSALAEAGLLGVAVPEDAGGMGFSFMELAIVIEEAGRSIAAVPLLSHATAMLAISRHGTRQQCQQLLPSAVSGQTLLSLALEEAFVDDPASPGVRASADGSGYRLSGEKFGVAYAHRAGRIVVSAHSERGNIVVLVDPSAAGVELRAMHTTAYEPQSLLGLNDVRIDADAVLAGPETGEAVLQSVADIATTALCAHQLGVTDAMLRMTASYTSERKQFGVPIATFQAVGHRAANCFIDVECLRLTTYQAASRIAAGIAAPVEVDIAKIWAGDVGHRVSHAAQQLHGGAGVDREYPLWRFCLWARQNEMTLGSSASRLARLGDRCAEGEAFVS